jgi:hypothetical protein
MSTSATGTRSPPRILSRMVRLLAGLMSLNTATKKQFAISLRNYGTADRELLVTGIGLAALMNLRGHVEPDMAMRYLDVTLTDLKREYQLARSKPQHLTPQPNPPVARFELASSACSTCWRWTAERCQPALPAPPARPPPVHKNRRGKGRRAQPNPRLRQRLAGKARHRTGIRVLHEPQNKILIDNCNSRGVPRPVA